MHNPFKSLTTSFSMLLTGGLLLAGLSSRDADAQARRTPTEVWKQNTPTPVVAPPTAADPAPGTGVTIRKRSSSARTSASDPWQRRRTGGRNRVFSSRRGFGGYGGYGSYWNNSPRRGSASNDTTSENLVSAQFGFYAMSVPFYAFNHNFMYAEAQQIFGGNKDNGKPHITLGVTALTNFNVGDPVSSHSTNSNTYRVPLRRTIPQVDINFGLMAEQAFLNKRLTIREQLQGSVSPTRDDIYTMAAKTKVSAAYKVTSGVSVYAAFENNLYRVTRTDLRTGDKDHDTVLGQGINVGLRADLIPIRSLWRYKTRP